MRSEPRNPANTSGLWSVIRRGIDVIHDLFVTAIEQSTPLLKVLLAIYGATAILAIVLPIVFIVIGDPSYALISLRWILALLVVVLVATPIIVTRLYRGTEIWGRLVPVQPLPDKIVQDLRTRLKQVRLEAVECIRSYHPATRLSEANLRAHMMLPYYLDPPKGVACELRMQEELQLGMEGYEDRDFRFHPNLGVSGRVFVIGMPKIVRVTTNEERDADDVPIDDYGILTSQRSKVPANLQWIISIPIRRPADDSNFSTLGVLSIHGMDQGFPRKTLEAVVGRIFPTVYLIVSQLCQHLVRVSTAWEPRT
ncbi:MAG: hypothetical protein V3T84_03940 [Phycisphaerales bacterium]